MNEIERHVGQTSGLPVPGASGSVDVLGNGRQESNPVGQTSGLPVPGASGSVDVIGNGRQDCLPHIQSYCLLANADNQDETRRNHTQLASTTKAISKARLKSHG